MALLVAGVAAIALVGAAAAHAVRRDAGRLQTSEEWQRKLRGELMSQAAFLDEVVGSLAAMTSSRDAAHVLTQTAEQAHRLLRPDATVILVPSADGRGLRPAVARGIALGPIAGIVVDPASAGSLVAEAAASRTPAAGPVNAGGDALCRHLRPVAALAAPLVVLDELHALLVMFRLQGDAGFGPAEVAQAVLLADFGASAAANAQLFQRVESLLAQARMREAERAELSRRILSAEQDERRKLSLFLHDGPLQAMSGIAMMLDAVAEDTADGSTESALRVLEHRPRAPALGDPQPARALLRARAVGAARPGLRRRPARARRRDGARPRRLGRARRRARGRTARRRPGVPVPDRARGRPERRQARRAAVGVGDRVGRLRPRASSSSCATTAPASP